MHFGIMYHRPFDIITTRGWPQRQESLETQWPNKITSVAVRMTWFDYRHGRGYGLSSHCLWDNSEFQVVRVAK